MTVTQLTQNNIEETINNNDIVVIDFWATWCGPCQTFKPIFEEASERHPDATFASCNTEEQAELAAMFQIRSIPTLVVFREGVGVFSQPGMLDAMPEDSRQAMAEMRDQATQASIENLKKLLSEMED